MVKFDIEMPGAVPITSSEPMTDTLIMASFTKLFATAFGLCLLASCASDAPNDLASTETQSAVAEAVSDTPVSVAPAASTTTPTTTEPPTDSTIEDDQTITCEAPDKQPHYVDVPLDDPDGGLNVRSNAGIDNPVLVTIGRSTELISTGGCETLGNLDWWEVTTSDGSSTGWVSSRFLSDLPVFNPGLGKAIVDTDNIGIGGETVDELMGNLAEKYGFEEDVVVTLIGEPIGQDAQGASVVYELTGLKDDASNGYRIEMDVLFDKTEENGEEIVSFTALKITNYALCTRGVTEDGLCT
ncbi:MAG: hypothetical protein ACI81L_002597 [Verrucomicrobiales bacterium]